jgi:hypothetical protein
MGLSRAAHHVQEIDMTPTLKPAIALVAAALLTTTAAWADPVTTYVELPSAPGQLTAVATNGPANVLDGARAMAFFSDGSSTQSLFVGVDAGSIRQSIAQQASSFALVAQSSGSSVSFPSFSITNTDPTRTLVGFRIDGRGDGAGQAAFDRGFTGSTNPSTTGSGAGLDLSLDFTGRNFITGTVQVSYSQPLGLNGAAPVGDLFSTVEVRVAFNSLVGIPPNSSLSAFNFSTDIDAVTYAPVPEPGSWLLMLAGVGLLVLRRTKV